MTADRNRRHAHRRTVGRWIDDMIRTIERKAVDPAVQRAAPQPSPTGRQPLRLRRDLGLVRGL